MKTGRERWQLSTEELRGECDSLKGPDVILLMKLDLKWTGTRVVATVWSLHVILF